MPGAALRDAEEVRNGTAPAPWVARNGQVVAAGLAWLRARLEAYIAAMRAAAPTRVKAEGVEVMSDLEADWLLRDLAPVKGSIALSETRAAYETARAELREAGEEAAIDRLSALFGLAPADEDLLLLVLAPRIDAAFQALFGYAHDRLSIGEATPHLAGCLLAPEGGEAGRQLAERLAPDAPLRRFALLQAADGAAALTPLSMDERVARYLIGEDYLDPRVRSLLRPLLPGDCPHGHASSSGCCSQSGSTPLSTDSASGLERPGKTRLRSLSCCSSSSVQ